MLLRLNLTCFHALRMPESARIFSCCRSRLLASARLPTSQNHACAGPGSPACAHPEAVQHSLQFRGSTVGKWARYASCTSRKRYSRQTPQCLCITSAPSPFVLVRFPASPQLAQVPFVLLDQHFSGLAKQSGRSLVMADVPSLIQCFHPLLPWRSSHLLHGDPTPLKEEPRRFESQFVPDSGSRQQGCNEDARHYRGSPNWHPRRHLRKTSCHSC